MHLPPSPQSVASKIGRDEASAIETFFLLGLVGGCQLSHPFLYSVLLPQVTIVVLGNKCDLQEQRRVDPDMAQHWAKSEKVKLWEVSVADRHSLLEPFVYLASKMTQPQSKSAFPLSRKNKGSGSLDG